MPLAHIRSLTSKTRSKKADRQLGIALAFIAGAVNAGGFLAVGYYTSHTTGIVSSIADYIALNQFHAAFTAFMFLCAFIAGAATSTIIINLSRMRHYDSEFAPALLLEAILMLLFGLAATLFLEESTGVAPYIIGLLCFMMGLQNAIITKISNAEIRTTHVTGLSTDIGIGLGRLLFAKSSHHPELMPNAEKLKLHASLLAAFFAGAIIGAISFSHIGFVTIVPPALFLAVVAGIPIVSDLRKNAN